MPQTQYIAKPILTPRDAIASHIRWKITLLMATTLREPLSPRAIRSIECQDECSIRAWLMTSFPQHLRNTPEHRAALDLHTQFHREMQRIALLIEQREFAEAERLLNCRSGFQRVSTAFANALMALDSVRSGKAAKTG